jgi:hypothetical protein
MSRRGINRRRFLTGASIASLTALAGCSTDGIIGESNEEANPYNKDTTTPLPDYFDESFQYHFRDVDGFNQIGGDIPEDAEEHQIVDSFVTRSDKVDSWQEMLTNDHNKVRLALDGSRSPNPGELDGSVEDIVQKTDELFQNWPENEEEYDQEHGGDIAGIQLIQIQEIEDKAEKFTMALRGASAIVTGHNNSAAANILNTNLAEYTLQQLDIEIPRYNLSTLPTAIDTIYEESERPAEFSHPIGFLQYEDEDENQKAKHFELENSEWLRHSARLDNSIYTTPLDQPTPISSEFESNNFLSGIDYKRGRELAERGELGENFDRRMLTALTSMVDDAPQFYDYSESTESGAESQILGAEPVISDSFGQSVTNYAKNPTKEGNKYLMGTSRAIFSAMDKQGWNEPIALDGTIENPEIYHATEQTVEDIHQNRAYDQVRQRVLSN